MFGLLAVMLLPLAEGLAAGPLHLDGLRILFLGGTISVIVLNYVPTRIGPAAACLGFGCLLKCFCWPARFAGRAPARLG